MYHFFQNVFHRKFVFRVIAFFPDSSGRRLKKSRESDNMFQERMEKMTTFVLRKKTETR